MKMSRNAKKAAYLCTVLILVLVILYSGLQILESTVFLNEEQDSYVSKTVVREGVSYFPRQDISVMMVLGIDQEGPAVDSGEYYNEGLSDVVMLLIFDQTNETIRILNLNRDTMMDIPTLGNGGRRTGTRFGQLALAHTYGSGLEDSCENTRNTLVDFLNGIDIHHYLSMRMDAITLANDAVGGVKVTVVDDFSDVDPSIVPGEMVLRGEQALHYIQTRRNVGDQTNINRMARHKEYLEGFLKAFKSKQETDENLVLKIFDEISPYLVTDCTINTLSQMMDQYMEYELVEIVSPEGENVLGEQYMEFYVDQERMEELILRLFYAPK